MTTAWILPPRAFRACLSHHPIRSRRSSIPGPISLEFLPCRRIRTYSEVNEAHDSSGLIYPKATLLAAGLVARAR